jgi:hypothetical protein
MRRLEFIQLTARPLAAGLLVVGAASASAHTQTGALGAAATATDYYQVTCTDDGNGVPASLFVQVEDTAPAAAPRVSAQVQKGSKVANTTDPLDADGSASPAIALEGGAGAYEVLVDKTSAGSETYSLTFHCLTATGIHTGSDILTRQSQ